MNRAAGLLLARGWMNLCAIASFFIVGRYLSPAEFGVYALASSAILLPMGVLGAGFSEHVISRDPDHKDEATAFWSTAAIGLAFAALAASVSLVLRHAFGLDDIAHILLWLAPLPALWGVSVIFEAMLIRDDRAGLMAAVTVTGETLGLISLVVSAMNGLGVFSLVVSRLVNNCVMLAGYGFSKAAPKLSAFREEAALRVGKFSIGVVGARAMNWLDAYGVELLLGLLLPAASIGHYRMAGRLNAALGSVLVFAPWQAQLAYLSERLRVGRLGAGMVRAITLHIALITPLFAGLAILSSDVIALFLGATWAPTAGILSIMALASIVQVIWGVLTAAFVAAGESRRMFGFQAGMVAVTSAALALGAAFSVEAAALAKFTFTAILIFAGLYLVRALSPALRKRLLGFAARMGLVIAAMSFAMILALQLIPPVNDAFTTFARIVLGGIVGLIVYLIALSVIAPDAARILHTLLRKRYPHLVGARMRRFARLPSLEFRGR